MRENSSDVRYEVFFILPIMIIAHQIYHDMQLITCVNYSIVEPQMTQNI